MNKTNALIFLLLLFVFACRKEEDCTCEDFYGTWEVVEIELNINVSVYPQKKNGYNPIVTFNTDGSVLVRLDINSCFGEFETVTGRKISFSGMSCTEACCDSEYSTKFINGLSKVNSYVFNSKTKLKLHGSNGESYILQKSE